LGLLILTGKVIKVIVKFGKQPNPKKSTGGIFRGALINVHITGKSYGIFPGICFWDI
jgi:hypothetical protein